MSAVAFLAVLCVLSTAHAQSGEWTRTAIANLTTGAYVESSARTLWGVWDQRRWAWTSLTFTTGHERPEGSTIDYRALVHVQRNPRVEGWEYIKLQSLNETDAGFTMGYAEGYITFVDMWNIWLVQVSETQAAMETSAEATDFISQHINSSLMHPTTTPFGKQLRQQMRQIQGLTAGWQARYADPASRMIGMHRLDLRSVYLISYMDELSNINTKFAGTMKSEAAKTFTTRSEVRNREHCSAMMKLTDEDFFFAHDTWSHFNTMLRQYKTYEWLGQRVVMSSYAGSISSIDDFYMTSRDLAVTETTNGIMNVSRFQFTLPQNVSEFNRVMIANYLATTPREWFELFATENSGTYNNQYMVADMAAIREAIADARGRAVPPMLPLGSFFVGEQIPGIVVFHDQTAYVNDNRYWPSFNVPFYPEIYELSGFGPYNTPAYWGQFNHATYARGPIMAKLHKAVTNLTTMYYAMRYNAWQEDHDSTIPWCKAAWTNGTVDCGAKTQAASLALAARYDLDPLGVPIPPGAPANDSLAMRVSRFPFGAIDTKLTSATMMAARGFSAVAINGPTAVQNPPFDRAAYYRTNPTAQTYKWNGIPNLFAYRPVLFSSEPLPTMAPTSPTPSPVDGGGDNEDDKKRDIAIGVGVAAGVCVLGVAGVLFWRHRSGGSGSYDEGRALV